MDTISAKDLGVAFVAFVTEIFMGSEGCSRPEVDEELIRLEGSGELQQARKDSQSSIDVLIDEILCCTCESRIELFRNTDPTILALVYDRVQCGTHTMIEMAKKGVVLPQKDVPPLPVLFRQLLLQKFS